MTNIEALALDFALTDMSGKIYVDELTALLEKVKRNSFLFAVDVICDQMTLRSEKEVESDE